MRILKVYSLLRTVRAAKNAPSKVKKLGMFYAAYKLFKKL